MGKSGSSRPDYTASEDDNVLVTGVEADEYALAYFGLAYYIENQGKLKLLGIDGGDGCVEPSLETVRSGEYKPLGRPIFIYVRQASLERPEVAAFVRFYLENAGQLSQEVGYVPLRDEEAEENLRKFEQALARPTPAGEPSGEPATP